MGFKEKILIITLLLFLMIGGVVAGDDNQTDDTLSVAEAESSVAVTTEVEDSVQIVDESSAEDIEISDTMNETEESEAVEMDSAVSVSSASSNEVLGANSEDEVLGASLYDFQTLVRGGGNVELTQDYIAASEDQYTETMITRSIHIYGNNRVVDAGGFGYIITIAPGYFSRDIDVVFENVIFKNAANTDRYGSAINIMRGVNSATFINCQFIGNGDDQFGGGAVYNAVQDCELTFTNCTFTDNYAVSGAAIYSTNVRSTFTLTNCTFTNNTATSNGGAIYANTNNRYTIINCTFEDNRATNGGAIYANSARPSTVVDSTFDNNTASTNGGAIYATNTDNAVISDNTVFTDNTAAEGNGGSIYWTGSSDLTIRDVSVDGSTSDVNGGAFYLTATSATVDNVNFSQTTATTGLGGAIYANGNVDITDSSFDSFTSSDEGAAIAFEGGSSSVSNSEFDGNNAILVDTEAIASLIQNTITDTNSEEGYAVSNKGTLSLDTNNFDDVIINAGDILTQTYTIVLNNETVYVNEDSEVTLNATIEDDNGNTIVVSDTFNFVDDEGNPIAATYSNRYYYATFAVESGVYVIGATESISGLNMNSLKTGTIVTKEKTYVKLDVTQVNEGEKVTIVATLDPEDATYPYEGNITFKVGDNTYIVNVTDGAATLVLTNVSADVYTVTATYSGDNRHSNATNSTYFIVKLYKTQISIAVNNILYGQNATAVVTTNANGTVVLIFNGRKEVEIVNGIATWNITDLEPGEYSITVVYSENGYYESAYNYTTFTVYKNNAVIDSIDFARVVAHGANNTITVTMGNVTEGSLIIEVNGQNYTVPIENSVAKLNVSLPIGKDYIVKAYFTGDNHFNATSKVADYTFEVTGKNVTVINITVEKVVEIDTENVNVTFKTNSDADLIVLVNDVNQTVNKAGDTYWFIADTSVAGTYTISAMTNETGNYSAGYNITTFTVIKHNSTVSVDVGEEFAVGTDFTITVTSNSTVNVTINGKTYAVGADGKVNIDTAALKAGEYIVIATVYESDKYYGNTTNKTFTITKHDAVIESVDVTPATQIGQNVTVTVTMGNVTEGLLIIEADGLNYSVPIVGGEAVLSFTTTKIGDNLPVSVYYLGDESYNAANSTGYGFNVTGKYNTTIEITASDIIVDGILNVTIHTNSSAPMTVQVNGENQTLSKTGDIYWFIADTSAAGNFTVTARTAEADYYYAGYNSTAFDVFKHNSTVSIDVNEVNYVGDTFTITVTSNTTANVTINGKTYTVKADGTVDITTADLAAGEYTVIATVYESAKYKGNTTSAVFNIIKYNSEIESVVVSPQTTQIGQDITVTVTMANVTEGTVVIEVNGANYTADINDGVATLTLTTTEIGNDFPVTAYFLGDYKYNASSKAGNTFNVTGKYNTEIIITASDVLIDGKLNVTIQTNTTAPITVKVNDVDQEVTKTGDVYWFIADTSAAGNYTVIASSEETEFYYAGHNSTTFNVYKLNSTVAVDVDTPHYVGDSFTITVTNNTAVNVTINGKTYAVKADGTVDIDTAALAAGEYTVTATVYENEKYYGNTTTKTFEIVKYNAEIASIEFEPVVGVGYNNTIAVTMANVTEGSLIIEVDGVNYTVNIADKVAKLNVSLPVGEDYTVKAYFTGDDRYNATEMDGGSFDVTDKNVTVITIDVAEVVVIDSENVIVTVTTNSTAPLTVQVNGVNQTLTTVDEHTVSFTADTSVAGTYTITAMTAENADYAAGYNVTTFKVIKYNSTVEIEVGEEYTVGSEFTIKVSTNATANVTVNGKTYTVKDDGTVDIDTTELAAGEYTVTATVYESDKYYGNTTSKTFTIVKHDSVIDSVVVSPETTQIGQNVTVTVTMGNVTDGTLIIDVAGVNYSVPITDGEAVLTIPTTKIGDNLPVTAYFLGDETHYSSNKSGNAFNVTGKYNTLINISATNGVVDELLYVGIITNSSADLIVELNGEVQSLTKTGGTYWFAVDTSVAGTYTVVARTAENEYYYAGYNSTTFEIFKHNSTVSVDVNENYPVGSTFTITVTSNATANVTINGKTYAVNEDGTVDIVTAELPAGEYIITATVYENDKYYANTTTATFEIVKYDAEIASVDLKPVVSVDYNNTITVTMGNVTSGLLIIEVNGVNYTVAIVDSVAELNVSLPVGENYPVNVYFMGDMKYNPANSTGYEFDVTDKNVTVIEIDVESVVVVDDTLVVNITTNTTASLFVYVNGKEIELTKVNDNTYSFTADTSAEGTYTIVAISLENRDYASAYNSTTYEVVKHNSTVSIDVNEINYVGDTFTITVTTNATANVTVNGKTYAVNADGTVVIDTADLAAGEYTVIATVYESDKYYGNTTNATFKIIKYASVIESVVVSPETTEIGQNVTVTVTMGNVTEGTVIIEIDGVNYTAAIKDSEAVLSIVTTKVGNNLPVNAYFMGDDTHNASEKVGTTFNVTDKYDTLINISATNGVVDELLYVGIITNSSADLIVELNGEVQSLTKTGGTYWFAVDTSVAGTYTVVARTAENEYYYAGYNSTTFEIFKHNSTVSIDVNEVNYVGDTFTITVTSNATANVTINGKTYEVNADGTVDIDTTELAAGEYTVIATVYESDKYYGNTTNATFVILKLASKVNATADVVVYGNDAVITVNVPADETGYVTVTVNGQNYTAEISEGKAVVNVSGLAVDQYTVNVTYSGDDKFNGSTNITSFEVIKANLTANVTALNVTVKEDATFIITDVNSDFKGKVQITVDGESYDGDLESIIKMAKLAEGNKTAVVTFYGDDNYNDKTVEVNFTVSKVNVESAITATDLANGTVLVTVGDNATGNVTIKVGDNEYTAELVNGTASIDLVNETPGRYNITVSYSGDESHNEASVNSTATIPKYDTPISVNVTDISVGETAVINVTVPVNATGNITVTIDGVNYTEVISNGEAIFEVENLTAGVKTVTVEYIGDDNYTANFTTQTFEVEKITPIITVSTGDIDVGEGAVINVTAPSDVEWPVLVDIAGSSYYVNITDGKGQLIVDNLISGNYPITVRYLGDGKYLNASNATGLTVSKVDSTVQAAAENITVGEVAVIEITVPEDATGNVTVTVGGETYTAYVANGKATVLVRGLAVGNYTAEVTYNGDDKYNANSNETAFSVMKSNATGIKAIDQLNGTVVVVVGGNATGNVTVKVGDNEYTAEVVNGTASVDLVNETPGEHNITVVYSGDENHNGETINSTAAIPKYDTPISVDISDIKVGEIAYVNVTVPGNATGNVTLTVDGVEYSEAITDGVAKFEIENLTAGLKTVTVEYIGDDNYTANYTTETFTVEKITPVITVAAENADVGEDVIINITAPDDVEWPVLVDVAGSSYYVNITDGKGQLILSDLTSGDYTVTVSYLGDDKYMNATNATSFTLSKVNSTVEVKVENITVGDAAVINITVIAGATGNVTVKIGDEYETTVGIVDGVISFAVPGLSVGNKTVSVTYNGDDKYMSSNNSTNFTVAQASAAVEIIAQNITYGDTETVTIFVNATGNVTIELNGTVIASEVPIVDGKVTYPIVDLKAGDYTVKVTYNGNTDVESAVGEANFKVEKADPTMDISVSDITYGETEAITVNVNTNGNVTIKVNGKEKEIILVNGMATLDVSGLASGKYSVEVTYNGNENYTVATQEATFNVAKAATSLDLEIENKITVGETQLIKITVNNTNASGNVVINIDGENYTAILTNGSANYTIPALGSGNHTVTVIYEGDANLTGNWTSATFTVSKYDAVIDSVTVPLSDTTEGFPAEIVVTMGNVTSGTVIVEIGGHNYTVPITDKTATLSVVLPVGEYTATAYYLGDENYTGATKANSTTFRVVNKTAAEVNITAVSVIEVDNNITFTVNTNSNSTLVVKVNGVVVEKGSDGKYTFNATAAGNYTIIAEVAENEYYAAAYNSTMFSAVKHNSTVEITVGESYEIGSEFAIGITNSTVVNVTVNGVSYDVADGKVDIDTTKLAAGNYTVVATIYESDKYYGTVQTKVFTVFKHSSQVNATGAEIDVGETAVVEITGPAGYNGTAVVTVNGTEYSVTLTNGVGQANITGLANGTYDVKVTLMENDNYLESTNDSAKIYVSKVESSIEASAENITVGDVAVIIVTLPEDASGNVTIVIGENTKTVPVSGGNNEIAIEGFPVGEYNISVTYNGNDKYEPSNTTLKLKVSPASVDLKVVDQGNGTVVVVVSDNATGDVTVKVGDNEYTAAIVNGTASVDLVNETPGKHDITVIYSGDENHTEATVEATATIPKLETPISIDVENSFAGDISEIVVTLPENATGSVTIEIDGKNYTKPIDSTGKATFEISDLTAGNKTVVAVYAGDDSYVANSTTAQFAVVKRESEITVTAEVLDKTALITVSDLPEDATGIVVVTVGGTDYAINITETNQVEVPITASGTYDVTAVYSGDDRFLGNSSTTSFTATIDDEITIEVQNETYSDTVTVKVTVPDDATGNVTVKLGNDTEVVVPVTGGENVITIDNVSVGTHDINVTYSGDNKYGAKTVLDTVSVYLSINAEDIKRGWNSPYDFKAEFLDSQGHVLNNTDVQFEVNGKTYTVKTDSQGIAYLSVPLAVGTYEITSINTLTGQNVTNKVTIVKRLLENKDITMDYKDGTYYVVLAIGDDGEPVGAGEFVDVYVNTIHYSCRSDSKGYVKLQINLNPAKYTVRSEYKLTKVTNKLVVKQTLKLVKKTVTVKKGKKLVLQAKLKWSNGKAIKGKVIKFKIRGKTYKVKTNSKGIAKLTIKAKTTAKFKKGKTYSFSATYVTNTVKGKVKVK